jgi:hypothetical protein
MTFPLLREKSSSLYPDLLGIVTFSRWHPGKNGLLTLMAELLNFSIKVDTQIDYY